MLCCENHIVMLASLLKEANIPQHPHIPQCGDFSKLD